LLAENTDDVGAELGRWVAARDSGSQDETDGKAVWKVRALGRNNFGLVLVQRQESRGHREMLRLTRADESSEDRNPRGGCGAKQSRKVRVGVNR